MCTALSAFSTWNEGEGDGVHAMPNVFRRQAFSKEYMSQMSAATGTDDLSPHTISIRHPLHRTRNLVIETGPPTPRIELVIRTIQRSVATFAEIRALLPETIIFPRERRLRRLMDDNPLFLTAQIVVARHIFTHPLPESGSSASLPYTIPFSEQPPPGFKPQH